MIRQPRVFSPEARQRISEQPTVELDVTAIRQACGEKALQAAGVTLAETTTPIPVDGHPDAA